jgi:hypothetical protein
MGIDENLGQGFITGVKDTDEQLIAGVVDTGNKEKVVNTVSLRIFRTLRNGPNGILRARGKLINEKNLMTKISCQTFFNSLFLRTVAGRGVANQVQVNITLVKNVFMI